MYGVVAFQKPFLQGEIVYIKMYLSVSKVSFSLSRKHSETYPLFFLQSHKRDNKNYYY